MGLSFRPTPAWMEGTVWGLLLPELRRSVMPVACAQCGANVELEEHNFFEGNRDRPVRTWGYIASLYHLKDGPVATSFCGPTCLNNYLQAERP